MLQTVVYLHSVCMPAVAIVQQVSATRKTAAERKRDSRENSSTLRQHEQTNGRYITTLEMWANAQRDGCPAEYRWRSLFNAAVWLCRNAAKT